MGRSLELELLGAAIAQARDGSTTLVAIEGEAGVGKTTLVSAALERAQAVGFRALLGRCDELESDRPFGVLLDALNVTERRGAYDATRREVLDLLDRAPDVGSPIVMAATPDLRNRIIDGLCSLVELEALQQPVVLVVEDLHWADPSAIIALRSIAKRVEGYRLLLIATSRPQVAAANREQAALWVAASPRLVLSPLSSVDVIGIATERLGADPGPRLRQAIAGTGGNPLLLSELLDSLDGALVCVGDALELTEGVPLTFAAGVQRRLDSLSPRTAELVQVASVLTGPLDLDDLAVLLDRAVARLVPALREAVDSGLFLDNGLSIEFRHDLIRSAVLDTLPVSVQRMLHREAAHMLIARSAPSASVAAHLDAASISDEDSEELRTWMVRAAREAMGRSPSVAHSLLTRARATLPAHHRDSNTIAVEQLEAAVNAGLLREAIELGNTLLEEDLDNPQWVRVRWWLGGTLFLAQQVDKAADLFEAAADATADTNTHALLLAYATMARLASFSPDVDALVSRAVDAADASGDAHARTLAHGLASRVLSTRLRLTESLAPARLAVEIADADPLGTAHRYQPLFFLALSLFDNGLPDEALATSLRGRRQAEAIGAAWAEVLFHGVDALIYSFLGRTDEAEVEASAGLSGAEETGSTFAVLWCHAVLAHVAIDAGDLDRAAAAVEDGERAFNSGIAQVGFELITLARGRLLALQGRHGEAFAHLCSWWDVFGMLSAEICQERMALAMTDIALIVGDHERAADVARQAHHWSATSPSGRVSATALACSARIDDDPVQLEAAAQLARSCGMISDARVLTALAEAARRRRGIVPAAVPVPKLGPVSTTPSSRWATLTYAEQRVCRAIADGLSNKAIAHQLSSSPRTIETHVTRILRKLDLTSRLQVGLFVSAQSVSDHEAAFN
ncbi:MAG: helix-turn-helix transcriptional regulator [Ilumatobacteraceae bacterium]